MDGYTRRRSFVRSRWLLLEPLEDRFLLSALPLPTQAPAALPASSQSSTADVRTTAGPAVVTPTGVTGSQPSSGDSVHGSAILVTNEKSSPARTTDDGSRASSPGAPAGSSEQERSYGETNPPPANQQLPAAATSDRGRDRDDGTDDDDDGRRARLYGDASEVRAAAQTATARPDDRPAVTRAMPASGSGSGEDAEEPSPQQTPAVTAATPALAETEKPLPAAVRAERAELPDRLPGAGVNEVPAAASDAAPEGLTGLGPPRAGDPAAGEVGLDLRAIEQGVEAFFARLSPLNTEGGGGLQAARTASWLTAVAAAALEIARVRDKARRSSLALDGTAGLSTTAAGESA